MKAVLVTGGAGFIGGHLCRKLCEEGALVIALDNYYTGSRETVRTLKDTFTCRFEFLEHDVRKPLDVAQLPLGGKQLTEVYHLACPASPPHYARDPLFTVETCTSGVKNVLELAKQTRARVLFTSTSEVYGDPEEHPQKETYRGSVNTWGPRACYDEGKRVGETLCYIYERTHGVDVRVARIFNTYGPGMNPEDGRVLTNFFEAVRKEQPLPVYGDGKQTRSFCFVSDMVEGLIMLCRSHVKGPVNLGNPSEVSILDVARLIHRLFGKGEVQLDFKPLPQDDPKKRCPDISRARSELNWQPQITLEEGLRQMHHAWIK